jgi:hypothetical protein
MCHTTSSGGTTSSLTPNGLFAVFVKEGNGWTMTNEQMNALYEGQKALCDLVKITSEPMYREALTAINEAIRYAERPPEDIFDRTLTTNKMQDILLKPYKDEWVKRMVAKLGEPDAVDK